MKQYRPIAGTWDSDMEGMIHMPDSCEVHETDKAPQFTGLLDASGTRLYRIPPSVKFGFHTKD
jgi:hypothetical protein